MVFFGGGFVLVTLNVKHQQLYCMYNRNITWDFVRAWIHAGDSALARKEDGARPLQQHIDKASEE